jgi:hypothetical protein
MKLKLVLFFLLLLQLAFAQKGTIKGTLTDKEMNNEPLPFANVIVKGSSLGTTTDENGKFELIVPAGNQTITFSFIGYETLEVPVTIIVNEITTINKALGAGTGMMLQDVVVQTAVSREKESALLLEQKNAVQIKQAIGAQEMSRKGVSDAEGAVTKVTGISKQQGEKNVFVRGLGDRYNSTTLNGLPLPSEDPEYKNISLDFFTSDIINNVSVNKVFGSNIYGDVAGANIDIISKDLAGNNGFEVGFSTGVNSQTYNQRNFLTIDGGNFLGTVANKEAGLSNLNSYNFSNNLNPNQQSTQINSGVNISGGKRFNFGEDVLNVFVVGAMSSSYNYREGNIKQTTNGGSIFLDQDFQKYTYNVTQTLMGNFKYRFENQNSISFNSIYIHDNNQDIGEYFGEDTPEIEGDLRFLRRQQINNNNLLVNQLLSEIKINENTQLNIASAFNYVVGNEPDRRSNEFLFRDGDFVPSTDSAGDNERYFSELTERDIPIQAELTYKFGDENGANGVINGGYNFRYTNREFSALIFNHRFINTPSVIDINNVDAIFNQANLNANVFELQTGRGTANNPRAFEPFVYSGDRTIHAAFGSFIYSFNDKLTTVVGARLESVNQEVTYNTNISNSTLNGPSTINDNYVLPNFNLKYSLSEKSNLRAAASMSYTLPQFKEVAPFKYQDVSFSSQGNPDLIPSENINVDLKWELFPKSDEVIAVTGFYKIIKDPISRSEIPSGGNTLTYLNAGSEATVLGLELEFKKNIYEIVTPESNKTTTLAYGLNVSYLNSNQLLDDPLPQFTTSSEQLQGASPLLINTDLSYKKETEKYSVTSSVVFNYFSDRVFSVGTRGYGNIIEKGIPTFDFVTQTTFGDHFGVNLKFKNLLDPDFQLIREFSDAEDVVLSTYKLGVNVSLGLTYKF